VGVQKVGDMRLTSPQLQTTRDLRTDDGTVFLVGNGTNRAAGQALTLNLTGLPTHSNVPRIAALTLAGAIIAIGAWLVVAARSNDTRSRTALEQRRESLLGELE